MNLIKKFFKRKARVLSVAGVVILNNKSEVLLQRRGDDNNWCIPGGMVEPGETIEEAAKREVYEETGITVDDLTFFNVYSGEGQHHIYPDGNEVYFVNLVFITTKFHGELSIDGIESKEVKFFDIDGLPENISPASKPSLGELKMRRAIKWEKQ